MPVLVKPYEMSEEYADMFPSDQDGMELEAMQGALEEQKAQLVAVTYDVLRHLHSSLLLQCPILSGNMARHITKREGGLYNGGEIVISGPSYDLKNWKKTGKAVPMKTWRETSKGKMVKTYAFDYAFWVNEYGAFGTSHHNSLPSKGWVDRTVALSVSSVGARWGAEVIINL